MRRIGSLLVRLVITSAFAMVPLLLAAPASANITAGPCDGSVTIQGVTYTPDNDTPDDPVLVPKESGVTVSYEGNTGGVVIKDHSGHIAIDVGPIPIEVATWSGENADEQVSKNDTYALDDAYAKLPFDVVGLYRVSGKHEGEGGSCEGFAYVKIEGNPITTVPGAAAVAVTAAAVGGVAAAGRVKRPSR